MHHYDNGNNGGYNQLKACQKFLSYHTKNECCLKGIAYNSQAISQDAPIKAILDSYMEKKATLAKANRLDLQAMVNPKVTVSQQKQFLENCLVPDRDDPEVTKHPSTLTWLQTGCLFLDTKATLQRGKELRALTMDTLFLDECPFVGPNGTSSFMAITNQSKTNRAGKLQHSAVVSHVNPLYV